MATASVLLVLLLSGCPAERLGVPVPPRGEHAISQEDLQRDAWRLAHPERVEGIDSAADHLILRLEQMGLAPKTTAPPPERGGGGDAICGLAPGQGEGQLVLVAPTLSVSGVASVAPQALLITLAKSIHGLVLEGRSVLFCAGQPSSMEGEVLQLEALDPSQDSLESIDYVALATEARRLHRAHLAPELADD